MVEYGIESTCDKTLQRINRGHTYAETVEAVERTAACGILTGGHIILDFREKRMKRWWSKPESFPDCLYLPLKFISYS